MYRKTNIRMTEDSSPDTAIPKAPVRYREKKNCQSGILHAANIAFKNKDLKNLSESLATHLHVEKFK